MKTASLERRVEALETTSYGGGGCERCRGFTVRVTNITGEFNSATWNGEDISEEDLEERHSEIRCPGCGSKRPTPRLIKVRGLPSWGRG